LPEIRRIANLFTGNVTLVRQALKRLGRYIAQKKLTIGSEKLGKSDSYDIA
jgi:hypothetical protein